MKEEPQDLCNQPYLLLSSSIIDQPSNISFDSKGKTFINSWPLKYEHALSISGLSNTNAIA